MRTFKTKIFGRWAQKEGLGDSAILGAVSEIEEGRIDASLGGKVHKKRIALPGRGKSGSVRVLIAYEDGERAFFMFGFAKNERANIGKVELKALKLMSKNLIAMSDADLKKALKAKELIEVNDD